MDALLPEKVQGNNITAYPRATVPVASAPAAAAGANHRFFPPTSAQNPKLHRPKKEKAKIQKEKKRWT